MKLIAGLYLFTILPAWIYLANWGQFAYKGMAYNLGRSLIWPAIAFPSVGGLISGLMWLLVIVAVLLFVKRQ